MQPETRLTQSGPLAGRLDVPAGGPGAWRRRGVGAPRQMARYAKRSERKRNENGALDTCFETIVYLYEWLGAKVSDKAPESGCGVSGSQPETAAPGLVDQAKRPFGMSIHV